MGITGRTIHIGILGYSDIAKRRFVPAAAAARNAVITAVGTRDPKTAAGRMPQGSAWHILPYDALLKRNDVDLVYVSLPNDMHEAWVMRALDSGKHVICEKPLGLDADSVARMTHAARTKGLVLYENIMYLHHPQHRIIRNLVDDGVLGAVRMLRAAFGFTLPGGGGFRNDPERGGGAFHDLARYPLSAVLYYLGGRPGNMSGYRIYRGKLDVAMEACGVTNCAEMFAFSIGFERQYENRLEIVGERGSIRLNRAFTIPADADNDIILKCGTRRESIHVPASDHFRNAIEYVSALILEGESSVRGTPCIPADRLANMADRARDACERTGVGVCE